MTDLKLSYEDMAAINRYSRRIYLPEELFAFSIELCDNEVDRDFERFSVEGLETLKALFLGKTCIVDHERKSAKQTARIYHTRLEEQAGETLVQLVAKAFMPVTKENMDTIKNIKSGVLKKVSIGCSIKRSICSVCGLESCGHEKGTSYGSRLVHKEIYEPVEVYDCAFVAESDPVSKASLNDMTAIFREALEKYGKLSQVIIANEEMSELTTELYKNLRGEDNKEHIAEKVADVLIMMKQMKLLFDIDSQVDGFMEMKLRRLQDRLEEYDGN